jgi:glutamate-1-semialdehyde 2,1-aminomutase
MIEQHYNDLHPGSLALAKRARAVLPSGVTHDSRYLRPFPIYVSRASGSRKWDVDGHEYVDYVMGHGALLLGHQHPAVTEAIMRQAGLGTHYGASHEGEVAWSERVITLVPSAEVVRFTSSGTEATLMALRIARAATGRPSILKFERHFHGWHDYVVANSSYGAAVPAGIPGTTLESVVVVPPDLATVREVLASRDDIGAVIVEPAGASSGSVPLPAGFNRELADVARKNGALFIMDEVVTGFRWSPGGLQARDGVRPDVTTLAKILAGGLPGGAVAGRRDLLERIAFAVDRSESAREADKIGHPGTFNANPLSAAAGVAALDTLADGAAGAHADRMASTLRARMNRVMRELGVAGVVYGESSALRIAVGTGEPPVGDPDPRTIDPAITHGGTKPELMRLLTLALLNRGVFFFGSGGMTSAAHTDEDVAYTLDAWRDALVELRTGGVLS